MAQARGPMGTAPPAIAGQRPVGQLQAELAQATAGCRSVRSNRPATRDRIGRGTDGRGRTGFRRPPGPGPGAPGNRGTRTTPCRTRPATGRNRPRPGPAATRPSNSSTPSNSHACAPNTSSCSQQLRAQHELRTPGTQRPAGRSGPAAITSDYEDLQQRYQMALQDVRELRGEKDRLAKQLAGRTATPGGQCGTRCRDSIGNRRNNGCWPNWKTMATTATRSGPKTA